MYYPLPTQSFGYYRGAPLAYGQGSGMGQEMSGTSVFSPGQGAAGGAASSTWSPTILYLFVLILAEMFIFGLIARHI